MHKHEPVYQALWAGPCDFDEVLISPVMIQDHMPDNMLKALNKVSQPDTIICQIKSLHTPVSRMSSVILGNYEILEETLDEPNVVREEDKRRKLIATVESNGHVKDCDVSGVRTESTHNVARTSNETIVVNVEVHEQKET